MPWDYSIYPELTDEQRKVFSVTGETLYMIQLAESAIQNCLVFAFDDQDITLEKIYSEEKAVRRKTLGQIVKLFQKKIALHPDFHKMLNEFVEQRNHFVHHIFNDNKFKISTDEECKKIQKHLNSIQDYAWNIQNVFWSYLINWMKETGVYEHLPKEFKESQHFKQVEQKPFQLLFQEHGSKLTHIVRIEMKKHHGGTH